MEYPQGDADDTTMHILIKVWVSASSPVKRTYVRGWK